MTNTPKKTEGARLLREKTERMIKKSKGEMMRMDIAGKLGVTPATFGHWEAERRRPTLEQAVAVKKLFKIKIEDWTIPPTQ